MSKEKKEWTYAPGAVFKEWKKVQWPTFKQLMSTSGLVIVFTALFGLYFFVCELAASGLVSWIVSL
jgi:preprotein translocase subunit SecE